jgi:DNA adenine methylase
MGATVAVLREGPETLTGEPFRPPLKWAGGKRWQVQHLLPYWQAAGPGRRLVEPFAGGLAVALGLMPERALLNDVNPHLVNFYSWLKRGLIIQERFKNDEKAYYRNRNRFNRLLQRGQGNTAEAAGLFYYLNRTGYNGLCRFNRSGGFNVPFGRYANLNYRYDLREYVAAFANWEFTNVSFRDLPLAENDFVYADPPYDVEFVSYSKDGFDWKDQKATAEWLAKHPGPVILSNQATSRILELYKELGFETPTFPAPRRISCTGDRSPALEVLARLNL